MKACQVMLIFLPGILAVHGKNNVVVILILFIDIVATFAGLDVNEFRFQVLERNNFYRRRHGVPNLVLTPKMTRLAQQAAQYLARVDQPVENDAVRPSFGQIRASVPPFNGSRLVDNWYQEIAAYNFQNPGPSRRTRRFTQMVWKASRELGVGIAKSISGSYYVVATYSPPGNVPGEYRSNVLRPKLIN